MYERSLYHTKLAPPYSIILVTYHLKPSLQVFHISLLQGDEIECIIHHVQLSQECIHLLPQALHAVAIIEGGNELLNLYLQRVDPDSECRGDVEPLEVAVVARLTVGDLT